MPYLFCPTHGKQHEAATIASQDELRELGECVLIVAGRLIADGWLCDSCNVHLGNGQRAWLHTSFPAHLRDDLANYDFAYERDYFTMSPGDRVAAYGASWPDDSLRPGRIARAIAEEKLPRHRPLSATELMVGSSPELGPRADPYPAARSETRGHLHGRQGRSRPSKSTVEL